MRFFLWLGFFLLSSCATTSAYYPEISQHWQGRSVQNLIKRWGSPDEKIKAPSGNTLYLYKTIHSSPYTPPPAPVAAFVSGGKPIITPLQSSTGNHNSTCVTTFEVNPKGIIVDVEVQGSDPGCA